MEPIANVVTDPGIVVVGKDSPYKTAEQFLAAVKANPGKITVGNSGVGGDDFFTTLIMEKASGLKVPDGSLLRRRTTSWQAAMGNKIDASFNNLGITYPQIAAGNLRALLLFADKRDPSIPNVPTAKELGFNVVSGSPGLAAAPPRAFPAEAKNRLIAAFVEGGQGSRLPQGTRRQGPSH
ncbi:MAG: tripartite tricarboxylate transporter substrate-binding protein [Marinilabiliales bacterium]|nr:tripartite tricarboxylate transporter substrate-binding protein [Marinilabiliales bacterium]